MEPVVIITDAGEVELRAITFKQRLAASMAQPIRRSLDYHGIARRALVVDQLPPGALPTYDRDIDVTSCLTNFTHDVFRTGEDGEVIPTKDYNQKAFGGRVMMPTFELASNPTIKISDVKKRRFNVIDRAVQTARQQIAADEDKEIFKALESINTKK